MIQHHTKSCYSLEIQDPKVTRKILSKSKTHQLARSRRDTQAFLLSSILIGRQQNKRFLTQKLFGSSGLQTLFFGWREATTGNVSVFAGYSCREVDTVKMLKQVQKHQLNTHKSRPLWKHGEVQLYHLSTIFLTAALKFIVACWLFMYIALEKNDTHKYSTAVNAFD